MHPIFEFRIQERVHDSVPRHGHLALELGRYNLYFEMRLRVRVSRRVTRVTRVLEALVLSVCGYGGEEKKG